MPTDILISSDPWENRVAILENGSLAEIYIEREEKVIGSIYKGKVQNVLPGMGASFIDIGIGRNAFLYVDDINKTPLNIGDVEITQGRPGWTIGEKINRGDDVLVQIVKEPRGLKGARVSTNVSLPGRYLILMPTGKFSGVSRKIESADERNRLKNVMKRIRPDGMATIVRTAAEGVSDAELIADLGVLIRMWHGILENYKSSTAPALVHKDMNLVYKAARDFITPEINRVLIDNAEECEKLRDFMRLLGPQYVERISYYPQGKALFRDFKVEEEIARLMKPKVNLPSGGSLVIETTEALTVIDINSGKYSGGKTHEDTILHTNLEAAAEIARQVRLRDIGGIIVCDFIDMDREASRSKVLNILETGLRRDRTRTTIQSFSALGLLEFTRKRVGKDLAGQLRAHCPTCRGLGDVLSPETVTIETFRAVEHHHHGADSKPLSIVTSPTVGAQILFWHEDELARLSKVTEREIRVVVDPACHPERTRVTADPSHVPQVGSPQLRVGDELDVDVLPVRMPNAGSGVAAIGGHLIEIENASGAVGTTLGIRVIDIDDESGDILAEPRGPVASTDRKRRRRKRGRPLTPEEQADELRELAEEAARIAAMPPPAARERRPLTPAAEAPAPQPTPQRPPAQPQRAPRHEPRVRDVPRPVRAAVDPNAVLDDPNFVETLPFYEEQNQARGRRRPFLRQNQPFGEGINVPPHAVDAAADSAPLDDDGDDVGEDESPLAADAVPFQEGQRRRRRRRRRGRGRGMGGAPNQPGGDPNAQAPDSPAMPNRSIFRVSANGTTEPTGQIAPPEPSREIAPWRPRQGHVAIDAPPPSLRPQEMPLARPAARRRGRPPKANGPAAQLTSQTRPALLPGTPSNAAPAHQPPPQAPGGQRHPARPLTPPRPIPIAAPVPPPAPVPAAHAAADAPRRRGRPPKAMAEAAPRVSAAAPAPVARASAVKPAAARAAAVPIASAPAVAAADAPRRRGRPPKAASAPVAAAPIAKAPVAAAKAPAAKAPAAVVKAARPTVKAPAARTTRTAAVTRKAAAAEPATRRKKAK